MPVNAETRLAQGMVQGVVLYDGQCGFCSRWVKYWAGMLGRRGFEIASLDEPWVAERIKMPHEELLTDIRLLTADGQLISGADVYLYVTRRIWWAASCGHANGESISCGGHRQTAELALGLDGRGARPHTRPV